ncbi:MAG: hypothetical protein D6706_20945 [Chloroflexi bacterium]|nr:MAG: hypothetical protein D6706_20945 [Chloroflexota bacterium]
MKKAQVKELVAAHAEALNAGEVRDLSAWLMEQGVSRSTWQTVWPLLQLAQAVKAVLVPVRPSPTFRVALHEQLMQTPVESAKEQTVTQRRWLKAAVVGSALSLTGLIWWYLRRNPSPVTSSTGTAV